MINSPRYFRYGLWPAGGMLTVVGLSSRYGAACVDVQAQVHQSLALYQEVEECSLRQMTRLCL